MVDQKRLADALMRLAQRHSGPHHDCHLIEGQCDTQAVLGEMGRLQAQQKRLQEALMLADSLMSIAVDDMHRGGLKDRDIGMLETAIANCETALGKEAGDGNS